jgi:hypothetical protein
MSDIYYHTKYIKYKSKYFKLKNDMDGGATGAGTAWPGLKAPVPGHTCKGSNQSDPSNNTEGKRKGQAGYYLNGCPDPSDNYLCGTDLSCIPKCFSNTDCEDTSDCSANMCIPKRTELSVPPMITELSPNDKLSSMELSFKKREIEAEFAEFETERKRTEKERNKDLLIAYNEKIETGTRRRGIKTKQRHDLEEQINNSVILLKRTQDTEKKELNKLYREALNLKDDAKKTYLIKLIEDLTDTHKEERERLKTQSQKRRNFLKEKQSGQKERNDELESMQIDFYEKYSDKINSNVEENKTLQAKLLDANRSLTNLMSTTTSNVDDLSGAKKKIEDIKNEIKDIRRIQEDTLFAMRSQKDEVISALKDNQTLEIRRENKLETTFNQILEAEIKLFEDQKTQIDVSGTQNVLAAFAGQTGGYPYYYMYGGAGPSPSPCTSVNCTEELYARDTSNNKPCLDVSGNPTSTTEATDVSCNWSPVQKRLAKVACAQLKISDLLCEQNEVLKDKNKEWRTKLTTVEKANDVAEAAADTKMAKLVKDAQEDYEKLLAVAGKRQTDTSDNAAAPAAAAAAANKGKAKATYLSRDFDINDYLTETEF